MSRLFLFLFLFLSTTLQAQRVDEQLDSLLSNPYFQTSQVSLMVYDLTADSTLYAYQPYQRMRPASCQKLVTAITALAQLGSAHAFKTTLKADGKMTGRTLQGNIYCVGGFDPLFSDTDMEALVAGLRQQNIDTIRGQICADFSMKSWKKWGEGWCWDDKNPTLSPLLLNQQNDFAKAFVQCLRKHKIVLLTGGKHETAERNAPAKAQELFQLSHSLEEVIVPMLKESNNLFAEAVFYHLAPGRTGLTTNQARSQVKNLLGSLGVNEESYNVADGSGLSLYNYTTVDNLVRLLRFADRRKSVAEPLLAALPIGGVDGTLKKRMLQSTAQGRVRAKTGTLTGISSLAGYLTADNGHRLCFAIINQGIVKHAAAREFQDRVCEILCNY